MNAASLTAHNFDAVSRERWAAAAALAVTAIVVAGLALPEYLIEIEAVAAAQHG
jgi:enamine deaminase RidA (YjgF/YER057c/UK114 family)